MNYEHKRESNLQCFDKLSVFFTNSNKENSIILFFCDVFLSYEDKIRPIPLVYDNCNFLQPYNVEETLMLLIVNYKWDCKDSFI